MKHRVNTADETNESISGIVVGMNRRGLGLFQQYRPTKRFYALLLIIVVLVGAGYAGARQFIRTTPAAKVSLLSASAAFSVDGKTYSKQDIKTLINYPVGHGATASAAAKQAFDFYKRQAAAKKIGIILTPPEIAQAQASVFPKVNLSDPWVTLASEDAALTMRLAQAPTYATASGYYFIFPFSNHIAIADAAPSATAMVGVGDATLVAQDRAYAKEQANSYYNQLVQKKITPDQALAAIKADPKLGYDGFANSNTSFRFSSLGQPGVNSDEGYLSNAAKTYLFASVGKVGVGALTVGQIVTSSPAAAKATYVDANYYFAVITKAASVQNSVQFQATLNTIAATYRGIQ